jgi:hypothetical protein
MLLPELPAPFDAMVSCNVYTSVKRKRLREYD